MKIEERERLCIELIGKFPRKFVLIEGYATSAFVRPPERLEVDRSAGFGYFPFFFGKVPGWRNW